MCGAFRLARFNLQASRPHVLIEGAPKLDKKAFVGLPIPPAGGLLAAIVHFSPIPLTAGSGPTAQFYTYALYGLICCLSILMVSTIRYSSMKTARGGRKSFFLVLIIAAIGMTVWFYSRYALLALAAAYVSHGVIWWILRPVFVRPSPTED
jgi:CDP-diacylglycerol--serine O-phosphatidyltransferase